MIAKKVIVCGSRNGVSQALLSREMTKVLVRFDGAIFVIAGGAPGVDTEAKAWCLEHVIPFAEVEPNWRKLGRAAGPARNRWMLMLDPCLVVAFPGGKGTANMVRRAREAGVEVMEVEPGDQE